MSKRRWLIAGLVLMLYLLTWVGGPSSHRREIESRAQQYWENGAAKNRQMQQFASEHGQHYEPIELLPGGPRAWVNRCFPVLPGVLLADSGYQVGRLWGKGGWKIVVFYGFGSVELVTLGGWIS